MPSKPENGIYKTFKAWVKRDGFLHVDEPIKFHRIESHSTELGIPDIYFETRTITGWIEQKYIVWPKKWDTIIQPGWQPGQLNWITKHNDFTNRKYSRAVLAVLDNFGMIRIFTGEGICHEYSQNYFKAMAYEVTNLRELLNALKS